MKADGQHLLVEYHDCARDLLNDVAAVENLMLEAARAAKATVVGTVFHPFQPHGVSGVVVIAESHLSIHTWPEYGYAAVDFFTCGDCLPDAAYQVLLEGLGAARSERMLLHRGLFPDHPSIRVLQHSTDDHQPSENAVLVRRAI